MKNIKLLICLIFLCAPIVAQSWLYDDYPSDNSQDSEWEDEYNAYSQRLVVALKNNNAEDVENELYYGANPDVKFTVDNKPYTPLWYACENCNVEIVKALVKENATLTIKNDEGQTLLMIAILNNNFEVASYLINAGVDILASDSNGKTALMLAVYKGSMQTVRLLFPNLIDSVRNAKDRNGKTALHYAVEGGWLEIAGYLIESGVNNSIEDNDGYTPFMRAIDRGTNMIDLFLGNRHFNVNKANSAGLPPLLWAIKKGKSLYIIELIVKDSRASVYVRDRQGRDALDYQKVYQSSNKELKNLLKRYR